MIRQLDTKIKSHFSDFKQVLVLLGARQVGKTTLLKRLFPKAVYLLVDEHSIKSTLETYSISAYKQIIGDAKQIILDEVHLLSNPGRAIKIIYDQLDDIKIIVTGSSALHIKNKTGESLAGRKIEYYLYPLTFNEYLQQLSIETKNNNSTLRRILDGNLDSVAKLFNQRAILNSILINGLYPNTVGMTKKSIYLKNLASSVVFKDIMELNLIDNRFKAGELLKLLAYQIGNLISYSEIGRRIGLSTKTVQKYIEIFEQSFIIYRLYPYFNNKRSEVGKSPKIYFWDLGLRNAVIDNFDSLSVRSDSGALFENFIINEVKKTISYEDLNYKVNYWRLKSGAEVDLVLSNHKDLVGCEIKLTKGKVKESFKSRYPNAKTCVVNTGNFY